MLRIGNVHLATNLLLAPIAGYCDLAFRTICREWGGVGLACTDLLSPQGLLRGTATSLDLAKTNDFDKPVGMQLYGSDPDIMAEGARWAVEHGATIVDINMGCPVDKVTKKDGGSKLLTNVDAAVALAARVRKELDKIPLSADEWRKRAGPSVPVPSAQSPVPLTCKMRLCWHDADYHAGTACSPHLARALADVGVAAVTVHGRTTEMKFSGECQRAGIARVVESVNGRIPVIGNGDVREAIDAVTMIKETGCQGVMIGRGALSTPWIFRDCHTLMTEGYVPAQPTETEILGTMRRYFDLMRETRDDRYALFQINRRVTWFAKRLGPSKPFKEAMRTAKTPDAVYDALDRYLTGELKGGRHELELESEA